jgi:hypothetical protein
MNRPPSHMEDLMNAGPAGSRLPSRDGRPARTGDEAPYTSESFEVDPAVGTDSPLGDPATHPFGPDSQGGEPVPGEAPDEEPQGADADDRDGMPDLAQP